jgi:uncharacterized membrane protein
MMNLAHLHLLLNHLPIIGTIFGLGLFLVSLVGKSDHLTRASLGVFCFIALLAIPAYQSGNAAQQAIQSLPGVSATLIEAHQDSALLALVFVEITGAVAWFGMWRSRRVSRPARGIWSAVLLLSIVTVGLMARTGNTGGEIRHPEIRSAQEATATDGTAGSGTEWLNIASVRPFTNSHTWAWPALETLHFIGLCLLFGILLLVNLRMLGMMKPVSFAALHRLLPWAIFGFGINAVTGMTFFIATPEQYTQNVAFYWKMILMLLAGVNVLYLTVVDEAWALGPGDDAPLTGKVIAASGIFLWVGVMYFGRMLPYIGNSF